MNILLVDDHVLFRAGLKFLLQQLNTKLLLEEAGGCAQALERVAALPYELILLDLNMPGVSRLDALAAVRAAAPETAIVVLSGESDPAVVRTAIERGAMGFIPKTATPELLIQALRLVLAGGVYIPVEMLSAASPSTAAPLASGADAGSVHALPGLTPRQMDVLCRVIRGAPNKTIARDLDVSAATVKVHVSAVLRALDARNRTEAVFEAARRGLRFDAIYGAGVGRNAARPPQEGVTH